jgi:3-oxoacyl-[acyl-carrier-protein] synthase II
MTRRVVVTGLGVASACGIGCEPFFANLMAGRSGISRLPVEMGPHPMHCVAARITEDLAPHCPKEATGTDRVTQLAMIAAQQALGDAGIEPGSVDPLRVAVYLGTGMGGATTLDESYKEVYEKKAARLKPTTVLRVMNNAPTAHISLAWGFKGPTLTYSVACASSAVAIGEGMRLIQHGQADVVVAGGSEALLAYGIVKAWQALHTLALEPPEGPQAASRPFAKDRTGLVLGEGAGILILESLEHARGRGAKIYGEMVGYGLSSDAAHITKPSAEGQVRAIRGALEDAGLAPEAIGYINAHGTATQVGDEAETAAIKEVFGAHAYRLAVSSTKSMHGHTLGAAGALEMVVTLLALARQAVPPTAHLFLPDPACDLDYVPHVGRSNVPLEAVMSNSFAFGGTNAVLVARRLD